MTSCTTRRSSRGTTASANTPRQAAAKISNTGASSPYSMFGALISIGSSAEVSISGLRLR